MSDFIIRAATASDAPIVLKLLHELADYEKLLHRFHLTEAVVVRDMLGAACHTELAFAGDEAVAVVVWGWIFKSFAAKRGLFLEDLYVRPAFRGHGLGKTLLLRLAQTAREADGFVEWQVLDWNAPSIEFYKSLGATLMPDWITCRLEGEALQKVST